MNNEEREEIKSVIIEVLIEYGLIQPPMPAMTYAIGVPEDIVGEDVFIVNGVSIPLNLAKKWFDMLNSKTLIDSLNPRVKVTREIRKEYNLTLTEAFSIVDQIKKNW